MGRDHVETQCKERSSSGIIMACIETKKIKEETTLERSGLEWKKRQKKRGSI